MTDMEAALAAVQHLEDDRTGNHLSHEEHIAATTAIRKALSPDQSAYNQMIAAERERQIAKGYTMAHDDGHGREHLIREAKRYAIHGRPIEAAAILVALTELDTRSILRVEEWKKAEE